MEVKGVKTALYKGEDLLKDFIISHIKTLKNNTILGIASKVVALSQGRLVDLNEVKNTKNPKKYYDGKKKENAKVAALINKEAKFVFPGDFYLTYKEGAILAAAGIDQSNVPEGYAVLLPNNLKKTITTLWLDLRKHYKVRNLGIIIIDSHCVPLREGTHGLALAYTGFQGVKDYRGKKDLYGKKMQVSQLAVADNLASAALLMMGESKERTPLVTIKEAPVKFQKEYGQGSISPQKCLFKEFYKKTGFKV